jgi:hypothetical protein
MSDIDGCFQTEFKRVMAVAGMSAGANPFICEEGLLPLSTTLLWRSESK